jgi:hypothetical protein
MCTRLKTGSLPERVWSPAKDFTPRVPRKTTYMDDDIDAKQAFPVPGARPA